jgi:hypothetical protein
MRRGFLVAFIMAVIGLVAATRVMFRPVTVPRPHPISVAPAAPRHEPAPDAAAAPSPETAAKPVEPAAEALQPTGWLNVRLDLGGEPPSGDFRVIVFSQKGPIHKSEELPGAESFKIGPVSTGKKAVFVFPQKAPFGAALALATVVEDAEVEVRMRLPKAFPIEGVVVDNTGRPVPEVKVDVEEPLALPEFRVSVEGENSMELWVASGGGGSGHSTYRGGTSHYSFWMGVGGVEFSYGAGTDSNGRFKLPCCSAQPAVTLKIKRGKVLIKEESVVPSQGPLRLVIPVQAEDPKK